MPQPVDFQSEVAKVDAVQRMQELADRASLVARQRQTSSEEDNRVRAETEVQQTTPSENLRVTADGRRRNPFVGRRRRRRSQPEQEAEGKERHPPSSAEDGTPQDREEGRRLDITV